MRIRMTPQHQSPFVPELGLGCAPIGNLGYERTDEAVEGLLAAAWDSGIRSFDTAPHYGLGLSEERLGRFLAGKPRDEYVVSTKVGRLVREDPAWDGTSLDAQGFAVPARQRRVLDYSAGGVRRSIEESLIRLRLDRVDIAFVHDPECAGPDAVRDATAALADLRAEGLVSAIGTGSLSPESLLATVRTGQADLIMVANRYTLLDQSVAPEVLEACDEYGTRIVAAGVFHGGILARRPAPGAIYDYAPAPEPVLARAIAIDEVCAEHGVDLATAAMRYPMLDPRVASIVVGAGRAEQITQSVARMAEVVPEALWHDLAERRLVPLLTPGVREPA